LAIIAAPAPGRVADVEPRAIDGKDPTELTLDAELQREAEALLARSRPLAGAIVAAELPSGRLLAFADLPAKGGRRGDVLFGKLAPAASLFKIVTSAALLEKAHVPPKQVVCTAGGTRSVERKHLEAPRRGNALCAPFRSALGHSRNAVYAQLVTRYLMRDDLVSTAERFGFNQAVPFDGGHVALGTLSVPYGDLDFARTATGFRGSRISVLGALELAAIVANGGRRLQLRVLKDSAAPPAGEVVMQPVTAREITRMMEVTVHSGTSYDVFSDDDGRPELPGIQIAGKTGTLRPSAEEPTTSWFIGFAPSRQPKIVVSVLLQNGRVWRQRANEVGRDLLKARFGVQR
jgi:cell division protein FtsI/penicillin-binding protein 2